MSGGSGLESQAGLRFRWVAGFGIAGLLIDLLPVQLTPGLHFSFGGAFALVPGLLFGPLYGAASVLLSQIPHALRWGFSEPLLWQALCAAFISYLTTRRRWSASGSALLFWAVAGPVAFLLCSSRGAGDPYVATKHLGIGVAAVNSIVNALFSEAIAQYRTIQRKVTGRLLPSRPLEVYVRQLFSPLVAVPLVIVMIVSGQIQSRMLIAELEAESESLAATIDRGLLSRVELHENYLEILADALATRSVPGNLVTMLHQHAVETFSFSDVLVYLQGMGEPLVFKGAADPELAGHQLRLSPIFTGATSASEPSIGVAPRGLSTSPSRGEASVRIAVPIVSDDRHLGVLVGHVPIGSLLDDIPVALQSGERLIWTLLSPEELLGRDGAGFPGQVVYASGEVGEADVVPVTDGAFQGDIRPLLGGDTGWLENEQALLLFGGWSSLGGSYYVVRGLVPAVDLLHQRLGGFVVLGLALLAVPLIGAPVLSRRVAQPVAGLADLSVRILSDRRLHNLLPATGESIDEVRRLTHFLQQTAMETRQLYHRVTESRQAILEVLVSTLEARDEGTAGHSRRVVYYALRLASELGVDEVMMPSIGWGSLLHDIGKIAVPDSILRKRGPLTEEEWQVMRTHCEVGYSLVSKIKPLKTATEIVRYHHERWDGTGYPFGLAREAIPLSARIFAVVDTLDAVTSPRPYRPIPHTFEQALVELKRHSGTQFDPAVVEAAVRIGATGWARVRREASEEGIQGLVQLIGEASDVGADDYRPSAPSVNRAKMPS